MQRAYRDLLGFSGGLALIFTLSGPVSAAVAQNMESGGLPAHTYVTVTSKTEPAPALTPADVQLKEAGKPALVTGLIPVEGSSKNIELAFLIDDGLRAEAGGQLNDVKTFFRALPPSVNVFVGYMQNGHVVAGTPGFTADHEAAVKALRIPMGMPGVNASPYFSLSDFVRKWPSASNGKTRMVFMVTNGVDNYTGTSPLNQDSPYVNDAIRDAQKAGVLVYSLYYPDAGMGNRGSFSGQGYLSQMAEETGGITYYEGSFTPVSFDPFLKQFYSDMQRLYEVKFLAPRSGLQSIKLSTDVKGIKLIAPEQVYVGEPE
ncbi:MAG TPA: hypothetical protein VNU94_07500 [Acidobacteriaceae bacterium]|jgi:hypothetical protein|nr:hypothetical protein [Acidobacteriaceae bacterium]